MTITGAHVILYSKASDADRDFFKTVLGFDSVDAGGGWLIFGLPPAEVAVHPGERNDVHELYLMTDDVHGLAGELRAKGVECSPISEQRWGSLIQVTLPSGGKLGVYQPKHPSPKQARPVPRKKKNPPTRKPKR